MSERFPDYVMEYANQAWLDALDDGTPDGAIIIARAMMKAKEFESEKYENARRLYVASEGIIERLYEEVKKLRGEKE